MSQPAPTLHTEDDAFDHGPLAPDDDYLLSDEPEDVLAVDPDARPQAEGPAETVAEKLRRIRAVVSRNVEQKSAEADRSFSEAQARVAAGSDAAPTRDRAMTETIRRITADLSDDEDAMPSEPDAPKADARDAEAIETNAFAAGDELDEDSFEDAPIAASRRRRRGRGVVGRDRAAEDDGWSFGDEADDAEETVPSAEAQADVVSDDDTISHVLSKSRAPEPEAETETEEDEPADVLTLGADDAVQPEDTAPVSSRRVSRPLTPITEAEGDVGRILAETDNKLNDGEGIRRRRVISQMRAAVAATKADRLVSRRVITPEDEAAVEQEPYRDALSEVVRNVTRPLPRTEPSGRASVAPLVLVSSQRVDDKRISPKHASVAVRPIGEGEDFAGFVKSMGAKELARPAGGRRSLFGLRRRPIFVFAPRDHETCRAGRSIAEAVARGWASVLRPAFASGQVPETGARTVHDREDTPASIRSARRRRISCRPSTDPAP